MSSQPAFLAGRAAGCSGSPWGSSCASSSSGFPAPVDDDTWDYLELGHNLLHHGIYGHRRRATILRPTPLPPARLSHLSRHIRSAFRAALAAYLAHCRLPLPSCVSISAGGFSCSLCFAASSFRAPLRSLSRSPCFAPSPRSSRHRHDGVPLIFAVSLGIYAAGRVLAAETCRLPRHARP